MRIATWNCSLGLANKKDLLNEIININNIDIICVQESEILNEEKDSYYTNNFLFEPSDCLYNSCM